MRQFLREINGNVFAFGLRWGVPRRTETVRAYCSDLHSAGFSHYVKHDGRSKLLGALGASPRMPSNVYSAALAFGAYTAENHPGVVAAVIPLSPKCLWLIATDDGDPIIDCDIVVDTVNAAEDIFRQWLGELSPAHIAVPEGWGVTATFEADLEHLVAEKGMRLLETAGTLRRAGSWLRNHKLVVASLIIAVAGMSFAKLHFDKKALQEQNELVDKVAKERADRLKTESTTVIEFAASHEYARFPSVYQFLKECLVSGFNEMQPVPTWLLKDQWCDGRQYSQQFDGQGRFQIAFLQEAFPPHVFDLKFSDDVRSATVIKNIGGLPTRPYEREALSLLGLKIAMSEAITPFGGVITFNSDQTAADKIAGKVSGQALHRRGTFSLQIKAPPELWGRYLDEIPGLVLNKLTFTAQQDWALEGIYYAQK